MSTSDGPIRWGILGTANIARSAFLPGLRATDDGIAAVVAGRERARAEAFADDNGVDRAVAGYNTMLADDSIDAVYVALPNSLHAQWTVAALRAGKAVLCEKPLCTTVEETSDVLAVAQETGMPLWEAFVYPFREQTRRIHEILESGEIGEVREVDSNFHFLIDNPENIRHNPALGGGALYDVGCYPISWSRNVLRDEPIAGIGIAQWSPQGVDEGVQGVVEFSDRRRLVMSCTMKGHQDTFSRVLGSKGEIRVSGPYHPRKHDTIEIHTAGGVHVEHPSGPEPPFAPAIRHIQAVLQGREMPQHLAVNEALGNATAIDLLYRSARSGRRELAAATT